MKEKQNKSQKSYAEKKKVEKERLEKETMIAKKNKMKTIVGCSLIAVALIVALVLGTRSSKASTDYTDLDYSKYLKAGDYKGLEYTYDVAKISDAKVEEEMEIELSLAGELEDRDVVKNNYSVTIDYTGTVDGKKFDDLTGTDVQFKLGSRDIDFLCGDPLDGFEDALIGAKVGDKRSFDVTLSTDLENGLKTGDVVHFDVSIKKIQEEVIPTVEEYVKKDEAFETVDDFKQAMREYLELQAKSDADEEVTNQLWDQLRNSFEVLSYPEDILEKEIDRYNEYQSKYLEQMGMSFDDALASSGYSEEEYNSRVKTSVESLMKDKLIAFYIADKENIDISDKAYEQYIDDYLTSEDVTKETIEKETGMSFEEYCELNDMYSVFVLQTVSDKVKELGTQKK